MKIFKNVIWIIFCIILFVSTLGISAFSKAKDIFGGELFANFALAGASTTEKLTDEDMTKEIIDIEYIKNDGTIDTRPMIICWPNGIDKDVPLIYVPHYALEENTADFVSYIKHGWAVASPYDFKDEYNGTLATDDLVFNNAALYTLRHTEGIDKQRIAIVGGSAGGYMAMMLNGLQMGTTAAIANAPIVNTYYNFHEYFPSCDEMNENSGLFDFKMPIQGMVSRSFQTVNGLISTDDIQTWEAVSPIYYAKAYSNPVVIFHNTSDVLVPVDQITHQYTYQKNDGTLPKGFDCHLPNDYPGILSKTFAELVYPTELTTNYLKFDNYNVEGDLPYGDTLITININDDGAPTAKGSHSNPKVTGNLNIFPYLEDMMNKSLANTEKLVPEKLLLLLDRYAGKSVALKAHEGIDDSIYGSLTIYQKEVIDELQVWANNHSLDELDETTRETISKIVDRDENALYTQAWEEIRAQLN